jgi:hypothetical protein
VIAKCCVATVQMSSNKEKFTPSNLPVLVCGQKYSKKSEVLIHVSNPKGNISVY